MKGMRRKGSDAGSAGTKEEQDVEVLQPSAGTAILEQSELAQMFNHRRLTGRQIQLIAIAGTIGASLRLERWTLHSFRVGWADSDYPCNQALPSSWA